MNIRKSDILLLNPEIEPIPKVMMLSNLKLNSGCKKKILNLFLLR
jgi:hypothetical protein